MPMLGNFVLEIANNPGTSPFVLSGAPPGRRGWSGAFADGEVYYFADDGTQAEWGIGRLTRGVPATISRDTVLGTTRDQAIRLNFTGTTQVYSALPAEAVPGPCPVSQGMQVVTDLTWVAQSRIVGSCTVTATGTTLRADFSATVSLNDSASTTGEWQMIRAVTSIYALDPSGASPARILAAGAGNTRIERFYGLTVGGTALASVTPGSTLRIDAAVQILGSKSGALYGMTLQDGALRWLCS